MRNDNGHESTLDRAIDHAVHQMMHVDPRPGLRQRVLHRLNDRPSRRGWMGLGAVATAAMMVLVFATTIDRRSETQPADPHQVAVQSSATAGALPPDPQTADDKRDAPPAPPVETPKRSEPTPESIFGPRSSQVRGASTPAGPQAQGAAAKPQPKEDRAAPQLANVKLDVTINDEREGVSTAPKTVSLVTADRQWGRSQSSGPHAVLDVDAQAEILNDGRIRVQMSLKYAPNARAADKQPISAMSKTISAILEDGKPLNVSESTDPASSRTVKVEIRATRVK